jgi:hypothetical protein
MTDMKEEWLYFLPRQIVSDTHLQQQAHQGGLMEKSTKDYLESKNNKWWAWKLILIEPLIQFSKQLVVCLTTMQAKRMEFMMMTRFQGEIRNVKL